MNSDPMLDEIMGQIGGFGKYQLGQHILHLLGAYLAGLHMLSLNFVAPTPSHRCLIPELDTNLSNVTFDPAILAHYIPFKANGDFESCRRYDDPFGNGTMSSTIESCQDGFVYDLSVYPTSRVYDWDMVCQYKWMRAFIQSIYVFGVLNGALFGGTLADKYGRKKVFYISSVLQLVFALIGPHISNYWLYSLSLFFYGMFGSGGAYVTGFVLTMEMVDKSKSTYCGTAFSAAYTTGICTVAVWAYFIRDVTILQTIFGLHSLLLIGHWWLVDESMRWLWGQGRFREATTIAKNAAAVNGNIFAHKYERRCSQSVTPEEGPSHGISDLFKTPNLRCRAMNTTFHWFAIALCFYGLAFNSGSLPGDPHLVFFLTGLSDFPGHLIVILFVDKTGRRAMNSGFLFVGGLACIASVFIPRGIFMTTIAMFAKIAMAGCFAVIYNYTAELFPTVVRNSAVGLCAFGARLGGTLTPQITLLESLDKSIPTIVFGTMALIAAFTGLFMPETLNKPMSQTLEDGENFGRGDTAFAVCLKRRRDRNQYPVDPEATKPLK